MQLFAQSRHIQQIAIWGNQVIWVSAGDTVSTLILTPPPYAVSTDRLSVCSTCSVLYVVGCGKLNCAKYRMNTTCIVFYNKTAVYNCKYLSIVHMYSRNHRVLQESPRHCTRFISLANVGNPDKKQRFLYAFNITPMASMEAGELTAQPQASTDCPYVKTVASYRQHQVWFINCLSTMIK